MEKEIELVWSYIVDYENQLNPFEVINPLTFISILEKS